MQYPFPKPDSINIRNVLSSTLFTILWLLIASTLHAQQLTKLSSPDGHISMQLSSDQGKLQYSLTYENQPLANGNIGFAFGDQNDAIYGRQVKSIEMLNAQKKQKHQLATRGNHNTAEIEKNE
jgi:hypothetical protein